jgi:predicted PurR-regulated permease PerM
MLFWSLILGGFLGALLAVPLTAAVKVLVRRFIWERQIMDGPAVDGGPSVP